MDSAIKRTPLRLMRDFPDLISALQRKAEYDAKQIIARLTEQYTWDSDWVSFDEDPSERLQNAHAKGRADDGLEALEICVARMADGDWAGAEQILWEFGTSRSATKIQHVYDATMKEPQNVQG